MAGSVKVSGSWRTANALSVKVGGTWRTVSAAYVKVGGVWRQWFSPTITDTFTRTTTTGLGATDNGIPWNILNGSWNANGSQAIAVASPGTICLASVPLGSPNAKVSVTAGPSTQGTGASFWVVDASNWWAAVFYSTQTTSTTTVSVPYCSTCATQCKTCAGTYPNCGSCGYTTTLTTAYTCSPSYGGPGGEPYQGKCYNGSGTLLGNQVSYTITTYTCNSCADCTLCGTYVPDSGTYPSCNCGISYTTQQSTVTTTNYYVRLLKSASGVVTQPTADVSLPSAPTALKVTTSGNSITVQAYSDIALTNTLGSALTHTASSPVTSPNHGIIKTTNGASAVQSVTVDNFLLTL